MARKPPTLVRRPYATASIKLATASLIDSSRAAIVLPSDDSKMVLIMAVWRTLLLTHCLAGLCGAGISGSVRSTSQDPVANAKVMIYKVASFGGSQFCNRTHDDIGSIAATDDRGQFAIAVTPSGRVDTALIVGAVVQAPGFQPALLSSLSQDQSDVAVTLVSRPASTTHRHVRGNVLSDDNLAIANATIWPVGCSTRTQGSWDGPVPGADIVAVTDGNGDFMLVCPDDDLVALDLLIRAPGFAPRLYHSVSPQDGAQSFRLGSGVAVFGTVTKRGSPVANALLGLVQEGKPSSLFVGEYETLTDKRGEFEFRSVIPHTTMVVYGKMSSLARYGALRRVTVETGDHGTQASVGDMPIESGYRVSGRVSAVGSAVVPANSQLTLGCFDVWDSIRADLREDGKFDICGLGKGLYSLHVHVPGFRLTQQNKSLDRRLGTRLLGVVDTSTNLNIQVVRGKPVRQSRRQLNGKEKDAFDKSVLDIYRTRLQGVSGED